MQTKESFQIFIPVVSSQFPTLEIYFPNIKKQIIAKLWNPNNFKEKIILESK